MNNLPLWMKCRHPTDVSLLTSLFLVITPIYNDMLEDGLTFFSNQEVDMAVSVGHSDLGFDLRSLEGWVDLPWTAVVCLTDLPEPTTHLCFQSARWSWNETGKKKKNKLVKLCGACSQVFSHVICFRGFFNVWKNVVLFSELFVKGSETNHSLEIYKYQQI